MRLFTKVCFWGFVILLLILSLSFGDSIFATDYFVDDFSDSSFLDRWDYVLGNNDYGDSWRVEESHLVSEVGHGGSSFLYTRVGGTASECVITLDVNNLSGVDQSVMLNVSGDYGEYYMVDFRYVDSYWPQDGNNIRLWKYNGAYVLLDSADPMDFNNSFSMSQGVVHKVKIFYDSENIRVYFDSIEVINKTLSGGESIISTKTGLRAWGGDYGGTVKNLFDNYRVYDGDDAELVNKIIIVPGLGASWNSQAIVYNEDVGADQWRMTPFVETYDGLTSAFEAKGLVQGDDFYVWNYDWRQPVATIADNFNDFVDGVVEPGEKVDVAGHSLGGLMARVWSQENLNKAGKIITLGSPHLGAVGAYDAWSGGKLSDKFGVRSIALNVLLQLQKEGGQTKIDTIRNYVPVLKDLLPTFDFAKMGRRILPVASLESQNIYLAQKNVTVSSVFDNLTAMVAVDQQTKEWIKLKPRSIFDEVLGIWPDGRVTGYDFGVGDGTVLKKSAKFEGDDFVEVSSNHGQMVNDLVEEVFEELSLGEVTATLGDVEDLSSSTVFFVGSPVDMNLTCDGDLYENDGGFVVFDGQNYSQCEVSLLATDEGVYHLVVGRLGDEDSWHYFEGNVELGDNILLSVDPGDGSLVLDSATSDFLYGLVKRDLKLLVEENGENDYLTEALRAVEEENLDDLVGAVFAFRKEVKESMISERILGNLETLLMIENKGTSRSQARSYYLRAMRAKSMVDRRTRLLKRRGWRPEVFGANSYELMTQKVEMLRTDWRGGDYAAVMARAGLVLELFDEVL